MDDIDKKIESPCVRHCCLDDHDICLGCFRSLEEIKQWQAAANEQRQKILNNVASRKAQSKHSWYNIPKT